MKILLITPYFFEKHRWTVSGYKTAMALSKLGYEVVVFTAGSKGQPRVEQMSTRLKVYRFRDIFIPDPVNFGIMPFMFFRLWRVIQREKPTHHLVYKYMFHTSLSVYLLRLLGRKAVVVTDTFPGVDWFGRSRLVNLVMWCYARTLGYLVLSLAERVILLHEGLVGTAKRLGLEHTVVHHNGVDLELYRDAEPAPDLAKKKGKIVILYLGRLESVKGYDVLLDAATELGPRDPRLHFLFVGDISDRMDVVEKYQRNSIRFLGYRRDVSSVLAASDIFVLPSYSEGLPNALMEAMATGCACISTRVGGVPWLLGNEDAGLTVPPGDKLALMRAIERLAADKNLRDHLSRRARAVIEEGYNLERLAGELVEILRNF
jgi:glycosyltransferase involved in cell wall biosynthesis